MSGPVSSVRIALLPTPRTKCSCGGAGEYECTVREGDVAVARDLCGPCARKSEDEGLLVSIRRITRVTT